VTEKTGGKVLDMDGTTEGVAFFPVGRRRSGIVRLVHWIRHRREEEWIRSAGLHMSNSIRAGGFVTVQLLVVVGWRWRRAVQRVIQ
jgi:hypothetical protein